jgi:K+ transporter
MKPITGLALFYVAFIAALVCGMSISLNEPYGVLAGGGMVTICIFLIAVGRTQKHLALLLAIALLTLIGFLFVDSSGVIFAAGMLSALLLLLITNETCYEDEDEQTHTLSDWQKDTAAIPAPAEAQLQKPVRQ